MTIFCSVSLFSLNFGIYHLQFLQLPRLLNTIMTLYTEQKQKWFLQEHQIEWKIWRHLIQNLVGMDMNTNLFKINRFCKMFWIEVHRRLFWYWIWQTNTTYILRIFSIFREKQQNVRYSKDKENAKYYYQIK